MPCDEKYVKPHFAHVRGSKSHILLVPGCWHLLTSIRQFESMAAGHLQFQILDSDRENSLFYSPIPLDAKHILDIGTGDANWAIDVADEMPDSALSLPSRVSLLS